MAGIFSFGCGPRGLVIFVSSDISITLGDQESLSVDMTADNSLSIDMNKQAEMCVSIECIPE